MHVHDRIVVLVSVHHLKISGVTQKLKIPPQRKIFQCIGRKCTHCLDNTFRIPSRSSVWTRKCSKAQKKAWIWGWEEFSTHSAMSFEGIHSHSSLQDMFYSISGCHPIPTDHRGYTGILRSSDSTDRSSIHADDVTMHYSDEGKICVDHHWWNCWNPFCIKSQYWRWRWVYIDWWYDENRKHIPSWAQLTHVCICSCMGRVLISSEQCVLIRSGAVITRSNITWYCIQRCGDWDIT